MTLQHKRRPIFIRLLLPTVATVLLTLLILLGLLTFSGSFRNIEHNALDMLKDRTASKAEFMTAEMVDRWSNLEDTAEALAKLIQRRLNLSGASTADMKTDASLTADMMMDLAPTLLNRLRAGGSTGVFAVLDGIGVATLPDSLAGVYLRDNDPINNSSTNNDVLLYRGLPPISRALNIPLDSYWAATCIFSDANRNVFTLPIQAARQETHADVSCCGYWSPPFTLTSDDTLDVITYSIPIVSANHEVLGIVGVDIGLPYLERTLYNSSYSTDQAASYVLGLRQEDGSIRIICSSGTSFKQSFSAEDTSLFLQPSSYEQHYLLYGTRNNVKMYASVLPLNLYDPNGPFDDEWVLVGMQPEKTLLSFSDAFRHSFFISTFMAIAFGFLMAFFINRSLVTPLVRVTEEVQQAEPGTELSLTSTHIREIDTLADALATMNHNAIMSSSRLSGIVHMTGMRMGVFELRQGEDTVYCSQGFFDLLNCRELAIDKDHMKLEAFKQLMYDRFTDAFDTDVWCVRFGQQKMYLRYRQHKADEFIMGTLLDVTEEINTRLDLEHARDIDALTGILNRRAFNRIVQDILGRRRDSLGVAALVMVDLDNLKFLNTTYGLDTGDSFISGFAHALQAFNVENQSVIARRSGDEFYMLFYGFTSRQALLNHIEKAWGQVSSQGLVLPDGSFYRYRASAGIAMFPEDADTVEELLHYADFALYTVKRDAKGSYRCFDSKLFSAEAYMIEARAALDSLIDSQLMHFAYQPIVSVKDADIMGYELLMRPDVPELKSPLAVLRLAKEQGKLHHIERLTWFCGMKSARSMIDRGLMSKNHKLFINSIASQKMNLVERQHIIDNYTDVLPQVVLELTESEDNNQDFTQQKIAFIRGNGGEVAIDDYGTGYNSELALVNIPSEYVKLDASFVRNVDKDPNKQALVKNLMSYARMRNIAILAEGVETRAEMETMISYGVDYLQGFYLGMPREKPQQLLSSIRMEIREMVKKSENQ